MPRPAYTTGRRRSRVGPDRKSGKRRFLIWLGVAGAVLLVPPAVLFFSILHFVWIIDQGEQSQPPQADAIVALSGDPARITQAVALLAAGYGTRLFITGVDNEDEVVRQRTLRPDLFRCCVEVDHSGQNTHEDAAAIARWTKERGLRSLVVVTSSPHLPRALIEINDALPGVTTWPSAVVKGLSDDRHWRTDPERWPTFRREYLKSIGALLRNRFPTLWPERWAHPI